MSKDTDFPEYELKALVERHQEHIEALKKLKMKLDAKDFTDREKEWHGDDPLEETHWDSFIQGFFVGRGLSIVDAKALSIYIY